MRSRPIFVKFLRVEPKFELLFTMIKHYVNYCDSKIILFYSWEVRTPLNNECNCYKILSLEIRDYSWIGVFYESFYVLGSSRRDVSGPLSRCGTLPVSYQEAEIFEGWMILTILNLYTQVRNEDGRRLPSWLAVDTKHGLISGVPQRQDLGSHNFRVTAHGRTHGLTAIDTFTVEVRNRYRN